jgi:WD40 repeat protein
LSPDGRLAVVAEGKVARLLRVETGRELGEALDHSKRATLASFAPDSKMVVTSDGTTYQVWDASTGRTVGKRQSCDGDVVAVAMGPAGAVYVEESTNVRGIPRSRGHVVWTEAANRSIAIPEENRDPGRATFSPDGRYLYIRSLNSRRLWDLSDVPPRRRREPVPHFETSATVIAFAGDSRTYAVAYHDARIEVRDTATDMRIGPPAKLDRQNRGATASALSFSPDGHTLVIGFDDGLINLLPVPLAVPEEGVSRWLERRTAVRLRPDLTIEALDRDQLLDRWSASGEVR